MFKNFSLTDLAVIALLLEEEEEKDEKCFFTSKEFVRFSKEFLSPSEETNEPMQVQTTSTVPRPRLYIQKIKRKRSRKEHKRMWVHESLLNRKTEGEFWTLYKELLDDEVKFHQYFKMSKHQFNEVLNKIDQAIARRNTHLREAISPQEKLAVCLRFLTTGDSMCTMALSYKLGHSTVWNIIKDVCDAIINTMLTEVMPLPDENEWERIVDEFWSLWNFPNCIGIIDGKHIKIEAPGNKKTSMVLLALVDAQHKFIAVDVGDYDKYTDGSIFGHSNLGKQLENGQLNIPSPKFLPGTKILAPLVMVSNEAFPLKNNLLRPYPITQSKRDNLKADFNQCLSRARKVADNAFGILAQRFRIYLRQQKSNSIYTKKMILTTCILHNYIGDFTITTTNSSNLSEKNTSLGQLPRQEGYAQVQAYEIREIYKQFLNSYEAFPTTD